MAVMLIKLTNKTGDVKDDFLSYPPGRAIFGRVSNWRGGSEDKNPLQPVSTVSRMVHAFRALRYPGVGRSANGPARAPTAYRC